jgi:Golgi phosphoprotein 3 (GPP34)
VSAMEMLGNDLVLLSIRPNGVIGTAAKLGFGLSGSELVRLTALGRVDVEDDLIIIHDEAPTGDALLDEALMSIHEGPPQGHRLRSRGRLDGSRRPDGWPRRGPDWTPSRTVPAAPIPGRSPWLGWPTRSGCRPWSTPVSRVGPRASGSRRWAAAMLRRRTWQERRAQQPQ